METTYKSSGVGCRLTAVAEESTVTFSIEKMTSATCPFTVRKAMKNFAGIVDVKVNYHSKTAVAIFNAEQTNPAEIAKASTEIGYPATKSEDNDN